ncbi:hypothetical protein FOA43_001243 [Brettanomyces nanus]|uniref:Translation machinery-associated protein 16 n=1 Tax=Eeniella nana TaxID=13502 RepID=A0A875RYY2_EENNA|nr:uncharacterized protein FOA43_001243 [Brettanomyces nanus]QPG73928.1 hypothetical protein FOA43_001243 [Brettanomyces nanus]
MPNAKSLRKVSRLLKHKNGALHPGSRKAKLLTRATLREEKVGRIKKIHQRIKDNDLLMEKFFQECINTGDLVEKDKFTIQDMQSMLDMFIKRDDEELDLLKKLRRSGRPPSRRQVVLQLKREHEYRVFSTGWKIPDLDDTRTVELFRKWKGDNGGLTALKFREIKQNDMVME